MIGLFKLDNQPSGRIFGLDVIRATAIVLVLSDHSRYFYTFFDNRLHFLSILSFIGVELFFVLSGYLVGGSLIRSYFSHSSFDFHALLHFWKRRWFRILPAYYLVLALCIVVYWNMLSVSYISIPKYLLFLQNYRWATPWFFPESWYLSVEVWFYLLIPFLFIFLTLLPGKVEKKRPLLLSLIISSILLFSFVRYFGTSTIGAEGWNRAVRQIVLFRLDAIGYGVLLAYFQHFNASFIEKNRRRLLLAGLVLLLVSIRWYYQLYIGQLDRFTANNLLFVTLSLSITFIFPSISRIKSPRMAIAHRSITYLSIISYPLYLINYSLILVPLSVHYLPSNLFVATVYFLFFWILCFLGASLLHKFYEKPLAGLGDQLHLPVLKK